MDDFGVADFSGSIHGVSKSTGDAALLSFDQVLAKMPDALRASWGRAGNLAEVRRYRSIWPNAIGAGAAIVYAEPSGFFLQLRSGSRRPFRISSRGTRCLRIPAGLDALTSARWTGA
jgi:hypothetical protein